MLETLKKIGLAIAKALLTEAMIKEAIIYLLKWAASKSDNKVDDKLVDIVEKALHKKSDDAEA